MGLLRPHRAVAPAPRAPTDARGDHARTPPRILRLVRQFKKRFFFFGKVFFLGCMDSADVQEVEHKLDNVCQRCDPARLRCLNSNQNREL